MKRYRTHKRTKGVKVMNAIIDKRPTTISESIIESCKEVKLMREGTLPKPSLQDLWNNIEQWKVEDKEIK